jgi:hypothetical protein
VEKLGVEKKCELHEARVAVLQLCCEAEQIDLDLLCNVESDDSVFVHIGESRLSMFHLPIPTALSHYARDAGGLRGVSSPKHASGIGSSSRADPCRSCSGSQIGQVIHTVAGSRRQAAEFQRHLRGEQ